MTDRPSRPSPRQPPLKLSSFDIWKIEKKPPALSLTRRRSSAPAANLKRRLRSGHDAG